MHRKTACLRLPVAVKAGRGLTRRRRTRQPCHQASPQSHRQGAPRQKMDGRATDRQLQACRSTNEAPNHGPASAPMFRKMMMGRQQRRSNHRIADRLQVCLMSTLLIALGCLPTFADELSVTPASMARIGAVDERFQSYNVEMVEVTGGRFWKPYGPNAVDRRFGFVCLSRADRSGERLDCESWPRRWRRPMCASAEPGQTPPILRIPTPRHRRRRPDSTEF